MKLTSTTMYHMVTIETSSNKYILEYYSVYKRISVIQLENKNKYMKFILLYVHFNKTSLSNIGAKTNCNYLSSFLLKILSLSI